MKYTRIFFLNLALEIVTCELEPFITGGSFVGINKYPHSVYLSIHCDSKFMCGGSVLNQEVILSAAHCLEGCQGVQSEHIQVKYGHERLANMKSTNMKKFVQHQKYDDVALINDIALIATKERLPLNNVVKRVILMKRPPQAQYAYVSGWGLDEKNRIQTALKHTNAQIQKLNVCRNMGYLPSGVFCAGPVTGLGAADQGDSGGALVIKEYIQIGLVSYKVEKYSLVAYTNVSMYIDWIHKNARNIVCAKG